MCCGVVVNQQNVIKTRNSLFVLGECGKIYHTYAPGGGNDGYLESKDEKGQ